MVAPLVAAEDLNGFQGGPFTQQQVDAAAAQVRTLCGWHIAPKITETVRVDSDGAHILLLPTMHITAVEKVTDAGGVELTGWTWSEKGMLARPGGFPVGFGAVHVTMTHGYDTVPAELLPTIAGRTARRVAQESLGARSVTYDGSDVSHMDAALAAYKLRPRP